ncbi:hypothetical protein AAC387_Pa05g0399 [Persea americana]
MFRSILQRCSVRCLPSARILPHKKSLAFVLSLSMLHLTSDLPLLVPGWSLALWVRDLDFGINVIGSAIVRDADGLALSSRNALSINKSLSKAKFAVQNGQVSCIELRNSVIQAIVEADGRIDYAEIVDQESLNTVEEIRSPVVLCVAAWFGKVRLIDSIEINIQ